MATSILPDPINRFLTGPDLRDSYQSHNVDRVKYARKIRQGGYDRGEEADYAQAGTAPVNQAEDATFKAAAASYARRGLGGSPMAAGAAQEPALKAAVQRQMAEAQARDKARNNQRSRIMDQYGAATGKWHQENEQSLTAAEAQSQQQQMMLDALTELAGTAGNKTPQYPQPMYDEFGQFVGYSPAGRR